jgi:hypothetical protein
MIFSENRCTLFRIMLQKILERIVLPCARRRKPASVRIASKSEAARLVARRLPELVLSGYSARRGDRALRHHLDQIGAIGR